ncbi:MFS transporter [uncultured Parasphingorhabdus sp.]|uniref:MFS transporter n=1 Tax=uncultured Parasphingorhabdus sp. TaxID=2709694 RepID=UPI0030DAAAB1
MTEAPDKLPLKTKILYGFGSAAYGIKDNGFSVFLLFYYNQVIGMRADVVSLAIAIALFVDAFIDPLIGQMTDRTRTPIGRRHPWLYGAALPIAAAWLLLWHPPEASATIQFFYLLTMAMLVRISLSAYEVPSLALLPELSRDYHDRTSILRYRSLFGWASGLGIMVLAYGILLVPSEKYPVGLLNIDGYSTFAIIGACIMAFAVLVSGLSTHKRTVARYKAERTPPKTAEGFSEMLSAFRFSPFLLLMLAGVFAFTNQGLLFSMTPYLLTHVWEFGSAEMTLYSAVLFIGVILAFLLVTPISVRTGKPKGAAFFTLFAVVIGTAPYWLRMAGLFPEPGSPYLIPILFTLLVIGIAASISAMILTFSMMADVTDAYEFDAGKRAEGLFSSGMWFMQKMVGGMGILLAGLIISFIQLPAQAVPGTVDPAIVDNLALIFVSLVTLIGLGGTWAYTLFPLGEQDHGERISKLTASMPQVK